MGSVKMFRTQPLNTHNRRFHLVICDRVDDSVYVVQLFSEFDDAETFASMLNRLPERMQEALAEAAAEMTPQELLDVAFVSALH